MLKEIDQFCLALIALVDRHTALSKPTTRILAGTPPISAAKSVGRWNRYALKDGKGRQGATFHRYRQATAVRHFRLQTPAPGRRGNELEDYFFVICDDT